MTVSDTTELGGLSGWTVGLMERLGGPGAGLAVFVENLFPPVPSEVILPMAGFASSLGEISLLSAIVWTTFGSVLGAWLLYAVGARLGHERVRRLIARVPLVDVEDADKSTAWFRKHGPKTVFFGRMIPFFRSFISIPAGTEKMGFVKFTVLTAIGSVIWNSGLILAGYALGANWHRVEPYLAAWQYVITAAAVIGLGWFVTSRLRRRRQAAQSS